MVSLGMSQLTAIIYFKDSCTTITYFYATQDLLYFSIFFSNRLEEFGNSFEESPDIYD